MTTEYQNILSRAETVRSQWARTLKDLKGSRRIRFDEMFLEANDYAFSRVDCRQCGRCCTHLGPKIKDSDISRLSRRERIKSSAFFDRYLRTDEDGDTVFRSMPCPFFSADGLCGVYEDRPDSCRDYPHLDNGRQKNMLDIHAKNLKFCPAVVLALEYLLKSQDFSAGTKGFTRSK